MWAFALLSHSSALAYFYFGLWQYRIRVSRRFHWVRYAGVTLKVWLSWTALWLRSFSVWILDFNYDPTTRIGGGGGLLAFSWGIRLLWLESGLGLAGSSHFHRLRLGFDCDGFDFSISPLDFRMQESFAFQQCRRETEGSFMISYFIRFLRTTNEIKKFSLRSS